MTIEIANEMHAKYEVFLIELYPVYAARANQYGHTAN